MWVVGSNRRADAHIFQSKENIFVKSVIVNGKVIEGTLLSHNDIINGGEIVFQMIKK